MPCAGGPPPRLLAISDRRELAARRPGVTLAAWAGELDALGVDGLQLREKDLDDRSLHQLALGVRRSFGGVLLINGRADLALACSADGVQLPADGLPTALVRRAFGDRLLIGCSTHSAAELAAAAGADFVLFGPVFATPGKTASGLPPHGLELLAAAVAATRLPVLALGGVTAAQVPALAGCGVYGVAAIRQFVDGATTGALVAAWHHAAGAPGRDARAPR